MNRLEEGLARLEAGLIRLEARTDARFDRMDARFDRMESRMDTQFRWMLGVTLVMWTTVMAAIITSVVTVMTTFR